MSRGERNRSEGRGKDEHVKSPFECVEPAVGDRVWELQKGNLEPAARTLLQAHIAVCDACRHVLTLDEKVETLVRDGRLSVPIRALPRIPRRSKIAASLAVAASLTLLVALPPRPASEAGTARGVESPRFLRPVEGEVVASSRPELRWSPIEGATRYVVELRDGDGVVWTGGSDVPQVRVGEGVLLVPGREYRALVSVRPADLAPPGAVSVAFRHDSTGRMVVQRVWRADRWRQGLALLSAAFFVGVWIVSGTRRELR